MRLFAKYNRINIAATIATFVVGSIAFYFVIYFVLLRQLDGTLRSEQQEITGYVQEHNQLPEFQNTRRQWITAQLANTLLPRPRICSTVFFDERDSDHDQVRQLIFGIQAQGKYYIVTVNRPQAETEDLLKLVILVTLGLVLLIVLVNYIINRMVINRLMRPFYSTIRSIKDYSVSGGKPLQLPAEDIDELALLNESLNQMSLHIYREYQSLKSFTENASHEMQTPLAVIRSKIEILLQDEHIRQGGIEQLLDMENAARKLTRLHQSLLLLAKLENRQFIAGEAVNMRQVISTKVAEWQDLVAPRNTSVHVQCDDVVVPFHSHLAEILVNNLLTNALRYTPPGGQIEIFLTHSSLQVSNTGLGNSLDAAKVFTRFYKAQMGGEGTGLGLAIIKEICSLAGFEAAYSFENNKHIFTIYFRQ